MYISRHFHRHVQKYIKKHFVYKYSGNSTHTGAHIDIYMEAHAKNTDKLVSTCSWESAWVLGEKMSEERKAAW